MTRISAFSGSSVIMIFPPSSFISFLRVFLGIPKGYIDFEGGKATKFDLVGNSILDSEISDHIQYVINIKLNDKMIFTDKKWNK